MKRGVSLIISTLILMVCTIAVCLGTASAEEKKGSITLICQESDDNVEGMVWHLYKVGVRTEKDYVFEGDFAKYSIALGDTEKSMNEWSAEELSDAAETLRTYIIADDIPYDAEGVTNANGLVKFEGLENGLYLAAGETKCDYEAAYEATAAFLEINTAVDEDITAYPKIIVKHVIVGSVLENPETYTVKKIWMNNSGEPRDKDIVIKADIYCDDEFYESVELSAKNNWEYEWTTDEYHEWFVIEREIPKGYVVAYKKNETQYLIVNTYIEVHSDVDIVTTTVDIGEDHETSTTTVTGSSTGTSSTDSSSTSASSDTTNTASNSTSNSSSNSVITSSSGGKLPQTGQLWWPVPIMGVCGVLLIGIGFKLSKKDD